MNIDKFHFIHPQKPIAKKNKEQFVVDIETRGLDAGEYMFGVMMNMDTGDYWVHMDPVALRDQLEASQPAVVYAHNAFGFDFWAFYNKDEVKQAPKMWKGSRLLSVKINNVEWRDSKDLMPMRLASIGDALGMPKGQTPEEYILGTVTEVTQEHIDYCVLDCRILVAALNGLEAEFATWCGLTAGSVELPRTVASMAYRAWSNVYWPTHWGYEAEKSWKRCGRCWGDHNANAGRAYYGGRVQCFKPLGELLGPIRSIDQNSMFPTMMKQHEYPDIEDVTRCAGNERILRGLLELPHRLVWADITLSAGDAPRFLPNTNDEGRRVWDLPVFDGWLCQPEISHALELGWTIERVGMIHHAAAIRPFAGYVDNFYSLRQEYQRAGDGRQLFCKLMLNSLYGKFGQRATGERIDQDYRITEVMDDDAWEETWDLNFYDADGALPYMVKHTNLRQPRNQWFAFAAFITSYARVELNRAIMLAGDDVVYCDTDSVHYLEAAHERMMSGMDMGTELGQWELETPEAIPYARYWEAKVYVHFNEAMDRILVKHKGVNVRDHHGSWLVNAGDLTKAQPSLSTFGYAESFRKQVEPGRMRMVMKKSRRHYDDDDEAGT